MFGDDPDSSVTIARFGFGAVFGHAKRGWGAELAREVRWRQGAWQKVNRDKERRGNCERLRVL